LFDLIPLAIQFGLGHWNARGHKSTDDGNFTADVWPGSAKTGDPSGDVIKPSAVGHLF